jgi:hypothetical protein
MRILVCGGRDYADRRAVWQVLDLWNNTQGINVLIQGGAPGTDQLALAWAQLRGVPRLTFHAEWDLYGPSAGPRRNERMLKDGKPNVVLAFPGGAGTADMIRRARAAGIRVVEPVQEPQPGLFMRRIG